VFGANFPVGTPTMNTPTRTLLMGKVSVKFSWTAQPGAIEYVLRIPAGAANGTESRTNGTSLTKTFDLAASGIKAEVAACNRLGCSQFSDAVVAF
jgi:hypothetical protein